MEVSNNVKTAYRRDTITKHLSLFFPEIDKEITGKPIHQESMRLSEQLIDKDSIEFVGCISSQFKIKVQGLREDVKGKKVIAKIWTDGTEEEPVILFQGIVDSATSEGNKFSKSIIAYDELYTKGNTEVAAWYKSLIFPITLKNLRNSLFNYIGLEQVDISLPNDALTIQKHYDPNTLQALPVIKAVCQINGAFGIINRKGKFEYRIVGDIMDVPYPSETLFPSENLFPADPDIADAAAERLANDIGAEAFAYYADMQYEEYEVKPIDKVTIRQSEDDVGVTYGYGTNNYIIQGNIFTYGLSAAELRTIAGNVYNSIGGFAYYPYQSSNNGLPFLECGLDAVSYYLVDWEETLSVSNESGDYVYEQRPFYIMNREMTGIQALRDSYSAQGEEYQSEYITDLQTQVDLIKRNTGVDKSYVADYISDYAYDKDYIDDMFSSFEGGGEGGLKFALAESVRDIPTPPDDNTLYGVQGIVVVY